jgi:hypothetical protein
MQETIWTENLEQTRVGDGIVKHGRTELDLLRDLQDFSQLFPPSTYEPPDYYPSIHMILKDAVPTHILQGVQ